MDVEYANHLCAYGSDECGPTIEKCGAFLMRGRRNGSVNYYYFHAHQCSSLLTDTRLCFCFIYHPIEIEGNIERLCSRSILVYAKHRITYVNAIAMCVRAVFGITLYIFSHEIHANQIRFWYMMTNNATYIRAALGTMMAHTIININSTKCMLAKTHKRKKPCGCVYCWSVCSDYERTPWDGIDRAHVVTMPTIQSSCEYFMFSTYRMYRCTMYALCTETGIVKVANCHVNVCVRQRQPSTTMLHPADVDMLLLKFIQYRIDSHTLRALASFVFHFTNNNDTKEINQYLAMSIVCRFERINWVVWAFQSSCEQWMHAHVYFGYNLSYCECVCVVPCVLVLTILLRVGAQPNEK